jgi:trehalose 6-phosphate phosphatase
MTPARTLPNLLAHWDVVAPHLRESVKVALFLDFDGTLVPFAPRPDQVRLKPSTRLLLRRLTQRSRLLVTVISGRRRRELVDYIALRNIRYWGLYGWERSPRSKIPRAARIALRDAHAVVQSHLSAFPGVWVEDKSSSLSIHVAAAKPAARKRARRGVPRLLRPFRKHLRVLNNVRDLEVVPHCISGKGVALRQSLAGECRNAFPLYFGDDYSDEPAFVATRRGISVIVGNRSPTRARFRLRDPGEVADALFRLDEAIA